MHPYGSESRYDGDMSRIPRLLIIAILCVAPLAAQARTMEGVPRLSARQIRIQALKRAKRESRRVGTYAASVQNLYENSANAIAIRFPHDWRMQELSEEQGRIVNVVLFLSPMEEGDVSQENINLVVEDLQGTDISPETYAETVIEQVRKIFLDFRLLWSRDTLLAGEFGHEIVYTAKFHGGDLGFDQVWVFHNGRVFVWTLVAPAETLDAYVPIFQEMLSTFEFD